MGTRSDELRADIEYRRERMEGTIDAIGDRVSPRRMARRRLGRARAWGAGLRERVMGSPEPERLVYTGYGPYGAGRPDYGGTPERGEPGPARRAGEAAGNAAETARQRASEGAEWIQGGARQVAERVGAERVGDVPETARRTTAGNPLVAGAVAFGLGALMASVLPETDAERQAAERFEPQIEAATEAAKEAGRNTLEGAKGSAQDAAAELKESAAGHAQQVKESAAGHAQQVKDQAQWAAHGVAEEARGGARPPGTETPGGL